MISAWLEATTLRDAVQSVPYARGEDSDMRIERVARHVGVGRTTFYNWLNPDKPQRIGLNKLFRVLDLCPQQARRHALARLCNCIGVHVETNTGTAAGSAANSREESPDV